MKYQHCSHCGKSYTSPTWPKTCLHCDEIEWGNPTPVAVVLQPIGTIGTPVFLIGRRLIGPCIGEFGLPGGFVDRHETSREAATRELMEEMSLEVHPDNLTYFDEYMSKEVNILLTFWLAPKISFRALENFRPNEEVSEYDLAREPFKLAFESHTLMLARAFEHLKEKRSVI